MKPNNEYIKTHLLAQARLFNKRLDYYNEHIPKHDVNIELFVSECECHIDTMKGLLDSFYEINGNIPEGVCENNKIVNMDDFKNNKENEYYEQREEFYSLNDENDENNNKM